MSTETIQNTAPNAVSQKPATPAREQRTYRRPAYEIQARDDHYELTVILPGIDRDEVELEVQGEQLRIRTARHEVVASEGRSLYRECYRGDYSLTLQLGREINTSLVQAQTQNGILRIELRKSDEAKSRSIPIQ